MRIRWLEVCWDSDQLSMVRAELIVFIHACNAAGIFLNLCRSAIIDNTALRHRYAYKQERIIASTIAS